MGWLFGGQDPVEHQKKTMKKMAPKINKKNDAQAAKRVAVDRANAKKAEKFIAAENDRQRREAEYKASAKAARKQKAEKKRQERIAADAQKRREKPQHYQVDNIGKKKTWDTKKGKYKDTDKRGFFW